ncbi:hypothetical protein LF1_00790 [Rubripirellula obstinata]|uniref:Uncharacterized protein n=1 Tax=Rubripirellula obstinata TaxID=406547 RepID=A0A5B1CBK4_9BACT|nr:hypothetical protein [Rubripirellula obstinata]KAA1257592.1 hypothetical protein LF1_00790 [Rubripirellula obstinata]
MSLDQLADRIVAFSETGQSTIVLVTPPEFSLQPGFYSELVNAIYRSSDHAAANRLNQHGIEIDFYQQPGGLRSIFSDLRTKRQASRIQRTLNRDASVSVQVRWTAILGRPSSDGPIVLGCCDSGQSLPAWAKAVELSRRPTAA